MKGYVRLDGRKGIRNILTIVYTVECAHFVADEIAYEFRRKPVHVIGFGGCAPNAYANQMMQTLCTHPNVGAVLIISLGCENFNNKALQEKVKQSGRPVKLIRIQEEGGTKPSVKKGITWVKATLEALKKQDTVPMHWDELIVGTICGGSDACSGFTANPAIGKAFDELIRRGGTCIFEEPGELIGCEYLLSNRAVNQAVADTIITTIRKADRYYKVMGHDSFSAGNATSGLTTIEEKSLGSYSKSGSSQIVGVIKPGTVPDQPGLFLMDVVPDGAVKWGFPNINDNAEIVELIACGSHVILFSTGLGSVVGSAIAPVIKVCANPKTYQRMQEDMDVNAGKIVEGISSLNEIGAEIIQKIEAVASGEMTKSEGMGHREFVLTYKSFAGEMDAKNCH